MFNFRIFFYQIIFFVGEVEDGGGGGGIPSHLFHSLDSKLLTNYWLLLDLKFEMLIVRCGRWEWLMPYFSRRHDCPLCTWNESIPWGAAHAVLAEGRQEILFVRSNTLKCSFVVDGRGMKTNQYLLLMEGFPKEESA